MKSIFNAEISWLFGYDIDDKKMKKLEKISNSRFVQKSETFINPITKVHNEGFFECTLKKIEAYDGDEIQDLIIDFFDKNIDYINDVLMDEDYELIVFIYVYIEDEYPQITFKKIFMDIINNNNATLSVVTESQRIFINETDIEEHHWYCEKKEKCEKKY